MRWPWDSAVAEAERRIQAINARQISSAIAGIDEAKTCPDAAVAMENIGALAESQRQLEKRIKELTVAVSDGIEHTNRSDRRIRATVARARKELGDRGLIDPAVEAENYELRVVDGDAGEERVLPTVPGQTELPSENPSSVRGVSAEQLRRARGW